MSKSGGLAGVSLAALGIVYGDIGTSPIYAIRETFNGHGHVLAVDEVNVLGVLSLVFWSLVLIISVKYLAFVMRADNDGEGGILALTALATPLKALSRSRWVLVLVGLFGTALLYGDGMITPAISVLSAVEGTEVATPSLEPFIVPAAVVILIGLFSIQRRGTASIGRMFGPVMLVWFSVLGVIGLVHIVQAPQVFEALNPVHAIDFFRHAGFKGFLALGSVFLVVTGGEALYADMGHFGRRPIQLSWFSLVLPALLLNYFGQGALLLEHPDAIEHPFYRLVPHWANIPLVLLATVATVIASQALISGVYSLTMQAVQMGYSPRVRINHTSDQAIGQIYIPAINWGLCIACVALVLGFRSSASLAAAYGVAVTATMVITTVLLGVVLVEVFGWSRRAALALCIPFAFVDVGFLVANLFKIPAGGWFPIVVAAGVFTAMTTWRTGRTLVGERIRRNETSLEDFLGAVIDSPNPPRRVAGTAVYLFSTPGLAPPALLANVRHNHALHERVIVTSVLTADEPRVEPEDRAEVINLRGGVLQVVLRYGFMEEPDLPTGLAEGAAASLRIDEDEMAYFLGAESLVVTKRPGMARWREHLFATMSRNATPAGTYFGLPPDQTVTLGVQVEL
jgi:KUP system potassium uptake protein